MWAQRAVFRLGALALRQLESTTIVDVRDASRLWHI